MSSNSAQRTHTKPAKHSLNTNKAHNAHIDSQQTQAKHQPSPPQDYPLERIDYYNSKYDYPGSTKDKSNFHQTLQKICRYGKLGKITSKPISFTKAQLNFISEKVEHFSRWTITYLMYGLILVLNKKGKLLLSDINKFINDKILCIEEHTLPKKLLKDGLLDEEEELPKKHSFFDHGTSTSKEFKAMNGRLCLTSNYWIKEEELLNSLSRHPLSGKISSDEIFNSIKNHRLTNISNGNKNTNKFPFELEDTTNFISFIAEVNGDCLNIFDLISEKKVEDSDKVLDKNARLKNIENNQNYSLITEQINLFMEGGNDNIENAFENDFSVNHAEPHKFVLAKDVTVESTSTKKFQIDEYIEFDPNTLVLEVDKDMGKVSMNECKDLFKKFMENIQIQNNADKINNDNFFSRYDLKKFIHKKKNPHYVFFSDDFIHTSILEELENQDSSDDVFRLGEAVSEMFPENAIEETKNEEDIFNIEDNIEQVDVVKNEEIDEEAQKIEDQQNMKKAVDAVLEYTSKLKDFSSVSMNLLNNYVVQRTGLHKNEGKKHQVAFTFCSFLEAASSGEFNIYQLEPTADIQYLKKGSKIE